MPHSYSFASMYEVTAASLSKAQLTKMLKFELTSSLFSFAIRSSTTSMSAFAILLQGSGMEPCRFAFPCSFRSNRRCCGICTTWLYTIQSTSGTNARNANRSIAI